MTLAGKSQEGATVRYDILAPPPRKNPWKLPEACESSFVHVDPTCGDVEDGHQDGGIERSVWCMLSQDDTVEKDNMETDLKDSLKLCSKEERELVVDNRSDSLEDDQGFVIFNMDDRGSSEKELGTDWVMLPNSADVNSLIDDVNQTDEMSLSKSPREPIILSDIWDNITKDQGQIQDIKLQRKMERRFKKRFRKS